ncbi:protein MFI isoform X2 [Melanotaenia boesemani]|uniref:protein MFI isoform X2 n=1 Tax=Melanotaenia boesemani TaxID=1250792 RepID=UPI001C05333C|nr:protein MFI isoform X2 [Melanotaenia boesemani]
MRLQEEEAHESLFETLQQVAARIIQKAWRRYVDPKTALRAINPREAELLDASAGVFIRFRLGGASFPPNIYYKIFTYRPIADLCASSPRDYTNKGRKKTNSGWAHKQDRSGWYQRRENNSWRLYCSKVVCTDKLAEIGADKKTDFHYSRLQRTQDVAKWRKRRKIGWLKKMYDQGRHAEQRHLETLENLTQKVMETFEVKSEDEILDWELDELLAWTDTLNFDEYIQEWKQLACSFSSEWSKNFH